MLWIATTQWVGLEGVVAAFWKGEVELLLEDGFDLVAGAADAGQCGSVGLDPVALQGLQFGQSGGGAQLFELWPQAPDAAAPQSTERRGVKRGNREQITHTLPADLLASIDQQARSRGMTRAGFINCAISRALEDLSSPVHLASELIRRAGQRSSRHPDSPVAATTCATADHVVACSATRYTCGGRRAKEEPDV